VGGIQALAAQDGALLAGRGGVVFGDDPQLVLAVKVRRFGFGAGSGRDRWCWSCGWFSCSFVHPG
jgi:hypothetical protein